jgi:hypothetical protein
MGIGAYLAGHTDLQHRAWMAWLERHKVITVDRRPRPPGLTAEQAAKLNLVGRQMKAKMAQKQSSEGPDAERRRQYNRGRGKR